MESVNISTTTGSAARGTSQVKSHVFLCLTSAMRQALYSGDVKSAPNEMFLGNAAKKCLTGQMQGSRYLTALGRQAQTFAFDNGMKQLGVWTEGLWQIMDGCVIKVFGVRRGGWGTLTLQSSAFFEIRSTAALREYRIPIENMAGSVYSSVMSCSGRMDMLSVDEARSKGVVVLDQFRHLMTPEYFRHVFTSRILEPEIRPKATSVSRKVVDTETEETRSIQVRKRRFAVDM